MFGGRTDLFPDRLPSLGYRYYLNNVVTLAREQLKKITST
jgi:hypothetical protein